MRGRECRERNDVPDQKKRGSIAVAASQNSPSKENELRIGLPETTMNKYLPGKIIPDLQEDGRQGAIMAYIE